MPALLPVLPLHDDEPTLADTLDRSDLVAQLSRTIGTCHPPQVLGVHGDWGAGKTSFLHQLQWQLTGECPQQPESRRPKPPKTGVQDHVTVVWFEAWRYQHEKAPIVALLQEIRSQLPWTSKVRDQMAKLGETTVRSALLAIEDITQKIGIQASKIQQAGETWEKDHLATTLPSHFIREHLEREIGRLVKTGDHDDERLVVIIDDLDRCDPASAYALLEGIKIYLNLPSCVFVLGMNQQVVEKAIADQLPDARKDSHSLRLKSREYLEKICQNIVHLPLLADPGQLLYDLLGEDFEQRARLQAVVRDHRCLPHNARKVKAFANLLRRNADRLPALPKVEGSEGEGANRWSRMAVIMACLYQFHPEIYRHLEAYGYEFYQDLRDWCRRPSRSISTSEHPVFIGLQRALWLEADASDETEPVPSRGVPTVSTFPDPVAGGVLRVQPLIAETQPTTSETDAWLIF